ncbi:MAG TPA: 2-dehydropantoate 2-reductase N-terminal domain-containing protein, partial [Opitutus sp.]|nr:2-dehydropantoate 2-reductase N-terminal domain-containing protein [Opitutus sp.]
MADAPDMTFAVVGAGAWGTAFAVHLARLGRPVTLAPRRAEQAKALAGAHENAEYLPGVKLPARVRVEAALAAALEGVDVVLLACPAQALRETCGRVKAAGRATPGMVVSLAKGLERGTHLRPSQVIAAALPEAVAGALTGPTN